MSYKKMDNNFSFTDLSLADSMEHNRSVARMEKINSIINWTSIESLLAKHYTVGQSVEGTSAYPPLLLIKCLLIQQWFHIDSDPELETQINDRISFKNFLGLSFDQASPDHSTFSRFRSRLSKEPMASAINYLWCHFSHFNAENNRKSSMFLVIRVKPLVTVMAAIWPSTNEGVCPADVNLARSTACQRAARSSRGVWEDFC